MEEENSANSQFTVYPNATLDMVQPLHTVELQYKVYIVQGYCCVV